MHAIERKENSAMALETELETYKKKLPELHEHEGKFVLIHGTEIVDFFVSYEDAIKEGYQKFKLQPFLVKQVQCIEKVLFISRFVQPANGAAGDDDRCLTSH